MKRALAMVTSIRTSAVLMLLVALLLLASVVVPQRPLLGDSAVDAIAASGAVKSFVIDTLGLGAIATSPLFAVVLVLFYLNLIAVLASRTPVILGKTRLRVPEPAIAEKWLASPKALEGTATRNLDAALIVATLRGFGYRPKRVSPSSMYAVKHRHAAIGFLLFHLSFFFLCAGGLLIWYTRWVGALRIVEGQTASAQSAKVLRQRPAGGAPDLPFTLEKMAPSFEKGEATDLRATVRFEGQPPVEAWVNHPAKRDASSLLVSDIGIAPVFWLQDSRGFSLDRVSVAADREHPVDVPLAGGVVRVRILPRRTGEFPSREALPALPLELVVHEGAAEVFRGTLHAGEAVQLPGSRLVLTEVRYWAGMKVISERGGGLLILGFVLATIGATWRLLLRRRDLVIAWNGSAFRLAGHGEWFADRDRRELMGLASALERGSDLVPAGSLNEVEVKA